MAWSQSLYASPGLPGLPTLDLTAPGPYAVPLPSPPQPPPTRKAAAKQPLSCAECRRLKLKCNRAWPCTSCVRRNCAELCPSLSQPTDSRRTHRQEVETLTARIEELEAALTIARAEASSPVSLGSSPAITRTASAGGISTFGMLSVAALTSESSTRYLGPGSASAYIDREVDEARSPSSEEDAMMQEDATVTSGHQLMPADQLAATTFPFTQRNGRARLPMLLAQLPSRQDARHLAEVYFDVCSYMYEPCQRDIFDSRIFPAAYPEPSLDHQEPIHAHRLALVFAIFALGALFDLEKPLRSSEAEHYATLAQECLSSSHFLSEPTLAAVQTLILLCLYALNGHTNGGHLTFPCLGLAVRLAQAQGLHRDPAAWKMSDVECNIRRLVWHDLALLDHLQALTLGRPPASNHLHSDTLPPTSSGLRWGRGNIDGEGGAFHLAKYRLTPLLGRIIDRVFGVHKIDYETVIELDEEWQAFVKSIPEQLLFTETPNLLLPDRIVRQSQALTIMTYKSILFLHRAFFLHVLQESPEEPLRSPYAASIVTILLEASRTLTSVGLAATRAHAQRARRQWGPGFHAYNGGVCCAAYLIKSPGSLLAPFAWSELQRALELLEAIKAGIQGAELLPRLRRLEVRARHSLALHHQHLARPDDAADDLVSLGSWEGRLQLRHRYAQQAEAKREEDGEPIFDAPAGLEGIDPVQLARIDDLVPGLLSRSNAPAFDLATFIMPATAFDFEQPFQHFWPYNGDAAGWAGEEYL